MKFILLLLFSTTIIAGDSPITWVGVYEDTGTAVEIESDTLVRTGLEIDIYDVEENTVKTVEIRSMSYTSGSGAELEIYQYDTDTYRTLEME